MGKKWRLSRAALYGTVAGTLFVILGTLGSPAEPGPPGAEAYYFAGRWLAWPILLAFLFAVAAVVRNFLRRSSVLQR